MDTRGIEERARTCAGWSEGARSMRNGSGGARFEVCKRKPVADLNIGMAKIVDISGFNSESSFGERPVGFGIEDPQTVFALVVDDALGYEVMFARIEVGIARSCYGMTLADLLIGLGREGSRVTPKV